MFNLLLSIEDTVNNKIIGLPRRWLIQNLSSWLSPLIIITVLLLSVILPFKAAQNHFILLIGLLVGIGAVLLFMRWPPLGLLGLIAARLVPFNGPSGITVTMLLVALLLGLWLFDMMVRQRKIQLVSSLTILPSLLLIAVALLAFGVGQLPWYTFAESAPLGAQMGGMAIYTFSVGAFLLMVHQIRDLRWLQVMTWLFLILSAIFIIGRITGTGQFISFLFPRGTTDSLFWTWLAALAFSQAVFNRDLHPVWRLSLGGLLLATFYVAYMLNEGWKSGWVPPVFVIVAILGIHFWRMALILTPFGIIPLSRLISYGIASDEYSYSTRIDAWTIVLEITKVNPILGLGPSNYRWYTPLFPIRGWVVQFNSHSQYIDLIAQTGLLGLACFVWFFGAVSWLGWQLQERVPSGFARAYVYGALGGLVGTLVAAALGDWVLPFFYNVGLKGFSSSILVWLFLGGLVALEQIYVKPNHLT